MIKIFTIGSNVHDAQEFFEVLKSSGVKKVIDVRLRNNRQFAGFTKNNHIEYFLQVILGVGYSHRIELAPTQDLFDGYMSKKVSWEQYEPRFNALLKERKVEDKFKPEDLDKACLLCTESTADQCHRRLVAEYFQEKWGDVEILHL